MRLRNTILILLAGLLLVPVMLSAVSEAGVIFLLIEPGSRPGAMGQAYVAQADDAFANYWNVGALAFNRKTQMGGMHTNWFGDVPGIDDMYYEYLAFNTYSEDIGNIGFNIIYLTYGNQNKTGSNQEDLGTFHSYEVSMGSTYAYQLNESMGLGIGIKFILSDLSPTGTGESETEVKGRGVTFAVDLGYKWRGVSVGSFALPNLDFGVTMQNIGPDISYINEAQSDPLPMNFRIGFSYRALDDEFNKFTINTDANKLLANRDNIIARMGSAWTDDKASDEIDATVFNFGGEYVYLDLLSLRAGYIYDKAGSIEGASFGAGIEYLFENEYKFNADFAMQEAGQLTSYNKTFSLSLEF